MNNKNTVKHVKDPPTRDPGTINHPNYTCLQWKSIEQFIEQTITYKHSILPAQTTNWATWLTNLR